MRSSPANALNISRIFSRVTRVTQLVTTRISGQRFSTPMDSTLSARRKISLTPRSRVVLKSGFTRLEVLWKPMSYIANFEVRIPILRRCFVVEGLRSPPRPKSEMPQCRFSNRIKGRFFGGPLLSRRKSLSFSRLVQKYSFHRPPGSCCANQ